MLLGTTSSGQKFLFHKGVIQNNYLSFYNRKLYYDNNDNKVEDGKTNNSRCLTDFVLRRPVSTENSQLATKELK